jgi:hypothetical protein
MKKILFAVTFIFVILLPAKLYSQFGVDLEGGIISSGYNDARIPGDDGTLFSFSDELESDNEMFFRIRLNYKFGEKHNLSVLYAPLTINANGKFKKDVKFQELTFLSNTDLVGTYTFNSYRFTYRYDLYLSKSVEFGLGLTGKIRDAEIGLKNNVQESVKDDFGFVPLINFRLFLKLNKQFGFLLAGDALAAPQGRAEDILAAVTYNVSNRFKVKLGYRILEGGADNDEVYTFSLIHYAAIGVIINF